MNSEFWWRKLQIRQPRKAEIIWGTWVYPTQSSKGHGWKRRWSLDSVECPLCPKSEKDKYNTLCSNIIVLNLALTFWEVIHLCHGLFLGELSLVPRTDTWRAQTKHWVHWDSGERSSDSTRHWPRCVRECQESLAEEWVGSVVLQGVGHWAQ